MLLSPEHPTPQSSEFIRAKTQDPNRPKALALKPLLWRVTYTYTSHIPTIPTPYKVGTGFKDHEREAPPPVGSVVTVSYFELTNAGVPRFPAYGRVRPDVPASDFT